MREELYTFLRQTEHGIPTLKLGHKDTLLNSFDGDYWCSTMSHLFFRGDCKEFYECHTGTQLTGRRWARVLFSRVDFRGWACSKEFAAMIANISLRRQQMYGIHCHVRAGSAFARDVNEITSITSKDFILAALAAGECRSIQDALRKKGVDAKVKKVLRNIKTALRHVEGTEGEREFLWMKFVAMRIWNGCSVVFFTINPHDIWNPLLAVFANGESLQCERISLDWSDAEMRQYYDDARAVDAMVFHRLAVRDPAAAAQAVHQTFRMVIEILFNCCPPANCENHALSADGYPCKCEPGMVGYLLGYLGLVEPQMRFTEHMHMLLQVLGFTHPRDFFQGRRFVDTFRRVWAFVASITFRSLESFAHFLGTAIVVRLDIDYMSMRFSQYVSVFTL